MSATVATSRAGVCTSPGAGEGEGEGEGHEPRWRLHAGRLPRGTALGAAARPLEE